MDLSAANDFKVDFSLPHTHCFVTIIKVIYGLWLVWVNCFLSVQNLHIPFFLLFRSIEECWVCVCVCLFKNIFLEAEFMYLCLFDLTVRKPNASTCMALRLGVGCDVCVRSAMPAR